MNCVMHSSLNPKLEIKIPFAKQYQNTLLKVKYHYSHPRDQQQTASKPVIQHLD